jgi:streptogramin lyase
MAAIVVNGLVFNVLQIGTTGIYTPWGTTSGGIVTVAGNGGYSYSGDGVAATSSALNYPSSVAVDHNGNIFIADNSNYRVRRVDAVTGLISTYAGNGGCCYQDGVLATQTSLGGSLSIALDQAGDLFIADGNAQRIRRVDVTTGIITTVAGNGSSGFGADNVAATSTSLTGPVGLTVDAQGNIYFNDSQAYRIRRVDGTTGIITTVAGTGISGYSGDNGLAAQAQISASGNFAQVAVDSSGNVYFSDVGNSRIRRIDAVTHIITTSLRRSRGAEIFVAAPTVVFHHCPCLSTDPAVLHSTQPAICISLTPTISRFGE